MGLFFSLFSNQYILVDVGYVSKWVEAVVLPTNDVRELATLVDSNNSQCSIMFPCLIIGICLEAGVPLLPFVEVDTLEVPLNHKTIDNSEAKIRAREIRAQRAPVVQPNEVAHDLAPPIPQPALATKPNFGIQFTQIQAGLIDIGKLVNNMQNTLVEVQHTQYNMQQELV
ncbi:hypothetical protein Adt_35502 [Abeliophyllum distichum]|uniref:Uncharacterized protein n=1 Tax=Abeliophyllum distichum TaxID=126358 RepID=A0ABD1QF56_9LAMI